MLRSAVLGVAVLILAACSAAIAPPTAGPTALATSAPTVGAPTPTPTTAILPTTAPSGGSTGELCGSDWTTSPGTCGGQIGDQFLFQCPPGGRTGAVYGTDTYTDDSAACVAAVHVGLITFVAGGSVTVELRAGLNAYTGTTRNGVDSYNWGSWPTSFVFIGSGGVMATPATGDMAALLARVPPAFNVNCHEVTTFSAGEVIAVSCTPPTVDGYITYILFDSATNLQDKFFGDLEYFASGVTGRDCSVGPCLVAKTGSTGLTEGRLFANNYTGIDPNGLISYWFDESLLIEAGLVLNSGTFADMYNVALQAGPTP
jgi:hypothetical protein